MSDRDDDIRATAGKLEVDAERLQAIEAAKVALPDGDQRAVTLSEDALELTEEMVETARIQLAVANEPEPD